MQIQSTKRTDRKHITLLNILLLFGSGALFGKMLLVRIIENNNFFLLN